MKIGLRHIRYFIAVAEELHFRRAAERLRVAQPALSRAIQHLERELGVILLIRSNRGVSVTSAGEAFLRGSHSVMNAMERSIENTRQVDRGLIGSLRIGYTDFAIAGALPNLLKEFQLEQPGIVLQPHHDVTTDQIRKLNAGDLDIGFVTGPLSHPGFDQIPLQSERFLCVVYENHRLAHRKSIRLEELAHENFVHGPAQDWEYFFYYLIPLCRQAGFVPRIVQEAFNSAGILGLVASGMGITILTESAMTFSRNGLVAIEIKDVSKRLMTVAVWRQDGMAGAMALFVNHLRARSMGNLTG